MTMSAGLLTAFPVKLKAFTMNQNTNSTGRFLRVRRGSSVMMQS